MVLDLPPGRYSTSVAQTLSPEAYAMSSMMAGSSNASGAPLPYGSYPPAAPTDASSYTTQPWYFDSGATNHITHQLQNLQFPQPVTTNEGVMVGNGNRVQVTHTGKGLLPTPLGSFLLSHVLHTPHITHNLLSVNQFAQDNNCLLIFDSSGLVIQDQDQSQNSVPGAMPQGALSTTELL